MTSISQTLTSLFWSKLCFFPPHSYTNNNFPRKNVKHMLLLTDKYPFSMQNVYSKFSFETLLSWS